MSIPIKKASKEDRELCRLITSEFRASYPHLDKPHAPKQSDKLKYSVTMLFEKEDDITGSSPDGKPRTIQEVMKQAKINAYGPKESWPKGIVSPVIDGDDPKFADKEGYKGCWVITAKANPDQRPGLVDKDMTPITDPAIFYPGCYARAYVQAYVNEYMGVIRVLFSLEHVQKIRDGKSFGGRKPVEQVFSPIISKEDESSDEEEDFK